nr:uroporphyrinogen-III synthase [Plastoroseomonas hellenica]
MTAPPGVLITRPEPGAAETARQVAAQGWTPVLAPALLLAPRPTTALPPAQALLLPSRAAARALTPRDNPDLPVLAVGEGTAAEARAQGFAQVTAADGDAASLTALVAATLRPAAGPLLLAVGEGYSTALAAALRALGFKVLRRVVYAATPATALPQAALAALTAGRVGSALFFSPRSATITAALLRDAGLAEICMTIEALALSPRIAAALAPFPWRCIRATSQPNPEALLALLGHRTPSD